jgi:hypothetical protein
MLVQFTYLLLIIMDYTYYFLFAGDLLLLYRYNSAFIVSVWTIIIEASLQ